MRCLFFTDLSPDSTIFAYGQTGSGKTYTMYGPPLTDTQRTSAAYVGVIPRVIGDIFGAMDQIITKGQVIKMSIYCSFVQIYNENLYDMLR